MAKKRITVLGGGTAGWMTAAALSRYLSSDEYYITLVESESIGTVGVGEATIPHLRQFNEMLGIDENEFIRVTGATYKLGIEFVGWGGVDSNYLHPFGYCGHDLSGINFHHYWLRLQKDGFASEFEDYSIAVQAARQGRFQYPSQDFQSMESDYGYAFHIDATLYAEFLRKYALDRGVERVEGVVDHVDLNRETGDIAALVLASGRRVDGDLFIDCSGFRSLLLGKALEIEFEPWDHWLPCDRAFAVPSEKMQNPPAYTRATAHAVGWQWRIPLQHRTGNGYVYASDFISDEAAQQLLLGNLHESPTAEPRQLRFTAGKRERSWSKNCVAVGLAAGFLEPLESTSIYLIQVAIQKLLEYFPSGASSAIERTMFNRRLDLEYERIRDFLVLHYHVTQRNDSAFWDYCRDMTIPDSLQEKIALFNEAGRTAVYRKGLFMPASWLAVYLGQGMIPKGYDKRVDSYPLETVRAYLDKYKLEVKRKAMKMQSHQEALRRAQTVEGVEYPPAAFSLYGAKG